MYKIKNNDRSKEHIFEKVEKAPAIDSCTNILHKMFLVYTPPLKSLRDEHKLIKRKKWHLSAGGLGAVGGVCEGQTLVE